MTSYSIKIKRLLTPRKVFNVGYANGMVGYVPTARAITEGGYEGERFFPLFGLPATFSESIEKDILESVEKLFNI